MESYLDSYSLAIIAFIIFIFLAMGVMVLLWIAVPFSLFGLKGLVREVVEEQRETNRLLESILKINSSADKENPETSEKNIGSNPQSSSTSSGHHL